MGACQCQFVQKIQNTDIPIEEKNLIHLNKNSKNIIYHSEDTKITTQSIVKKKTSEIHFFGCESTEKIETKNFFLKDPLSNKFQNKLNYSAKIQDQRRASNASISYSIHPPNFQKDEKMSLKISRTVIEEHGFDEDKMGKRINIELFGGNESGKTSFLMRFCRNKFENCYIPSITDEIQSTTAIIGVKIHPVFCRANRYSLNKVIDINKAKQSCFLIFFDFSSYRSFSQATQFIESCIINYGKRFPIFLVGNKNDLQLNKQITREKILSFCKKYRCQFFDISVKNNIGISALMKKIGYYFE